MKILTCFLLAACAAPEIRPGVYLVTYTIKLSNDPFIHGNFETENRITYDETPRFWLSDSTYMEGVETENSILFTLNNLSGTVECPFYTDLSFEIRPSDQGFFGSGFQAYTYCLWTPRDGEDMAVESFTTEFDANATFIMELPE